MKKVVFVDSQSQGTFHEIFNLSFLLIMSQSYDHVEYIASPSSIENLKKKINDRSNISIKNVDFKSVFVPSGELSYHIFIRKLFGAFTILRCILKYRKKEKIILSSLNEFSTLYLNTVSKFCKVSIQIICHGELEYLLKEQIPLFKPLRWYKKMILMFFNHPINENISLLLLGKSIKNNLTQLFPNHQNKFSYINHPYFFQKRKITGYSLNKVLKIGIVGVADKDKGTDNFFILSEYLKEKIENRTVEMHLIGLHYYDKSQFPLVHFAAEKGQILSTEDFNKAIDNLDIIMFFYNKTMYRLTASGAIFDAINNRKRIICLDNDYCKSILEDNDVGIVCQNVMEMKVIIEDVISGKRNFGVTDYDFQQIQEQYNYQNIILN